MIFQRDAKGMLHQLDVTLEQLAAEGKNTNLLVSQHMYVLFTDEEQANFDRQRKEAQDRLLAEKRAAEEAKEARAAAIQQDINKARELQKAREQAEAAKDFALTTALEQLAELKKKVTELEKR